MTSDEIIEGADLLINQLIVHDVSWIRQASTSVKYRRAWLHALKKMTPILKNLGEQRSFKGKLTPLARRRLKQFQIAEALLSEFGEAI